MFCIENQNRNFEFWIQQLIFENRALFFLMMWENIIELGRVTDNNMADAHCMMDI